MAEELPEPKNRKEEFLANIAGMDVELPEPANREEIYLNAIAENGGGEDYTAGDGITIADNTISVDTTTIQEKLTAGDNITIADDTISATDTTYSNFTGTDGQTAGTAGLVPAPATTDAGKFLKADGTWDDAGSSINVVQTTGTSTTDVMSQNATTGLVYNSSRTDGTVRIGISTYGLPSNASPGVVIGPYAGFKNMSVARTNNYAVDIGYNTGHGNGSVTVGSFSDSGGTRSVAIGNTAESSYEGSVAIGAHSKTSATGEMNIGSTNTSYGYNSSNYRLLTGLYDGQSAHDAATYGQMNTRLGGLTLLTISQTDYDNLDTKDPDTLYIITGA